MLHIVVIAVHCTEGTSVAPAKYDDYRCGSIALLFPPGSAGTETDDWSVVKDQTNPTSAPPCGPRVNMSHQKTKHRRQI